MVPVDSSSQPVHLVRPSPYPLPTTTSLAPLLHENRQPLSWGHGHRWTRVRARAAAMASPIAFRLSERACGIVQVQLALDQTYTRTDATNANAGRSKHDMAWRMSSGTRLSETISQSLISWSGINNQELTLRLAHLKRGAGQAWTGKAAKAQ